MLFDAIFGTPFQAKTDGKNRFNHFQPVAVDNRLDFCVDMAGMIVGSLPPELFLTVFTETAEGTPPVPEVNFNDVPSNNVTEAEMYPWLARDFQKLTPGFEWFIAADDTGKGSEVKLRPDLGCIERGRWEDRVDNSEPPPPPSQASTSTSKAPTQPPQKPKPRRKTKKGQSLAGKLFAAITSFGGHADDQSSASPSPSPSPAPQPQPGPQPPSVPVIPSRPFDWKRCEFGCEVKSSDDDDAFTDTDPKTVEASSGRARLNRGQLISYIKEQASRQHRTGNFQLYVFGDWARLLWYDRSGGVVSQKFNYKENPKLLATFLWQYSHLSQEQRGWDPTVVAASPAETDLFETMMKPFIERVGRPSESDLSELKCDKFKDTLDNTYPTYKLTVTSPKYSADLLIRRPFFQPFSACGRATRGYLAYDIARGQVVFLKDTWRTDSQDRLPESEIYEVLKGCGIEHLPEVLYAGDVHLANGSRQETFVDTFIRRGYNWARPSAVTRSHVHCRIVQSVAYPLSSFRDSREFVQVLRDILVAIEYAYEHGILHRDISFGNVMISEEGRGILNDWDHSRADPRCHNPNDAAAGPPFRTGTWQFLSIHQLEDPKHLHTIVDDLESVFWVLLWGALHHLKHADPSANSFNMFDEIELESGQIATAKGGSKKRTRLLKGELERLQFDSAPLSALIADLAAEWSIIYDNETNRNPSVRKIAEDKYNQLADVRYTIEKFDAALARDDWPTKDRLRDQFPRRSSKKAATIYHRSLLSSFITHSPSGTGQQAVGAAPATSITPPPESKSSQVALSPPEPIHTRFRGVVPGTPSRTGTALPSVVGTSGASAVPSTVMSSPPSTSVRRKRSEDYSHLFSTPKRMRSGDK